MERARHILLNEYCQSTGLERKHVIKVLRGQRRRFPSGARRGVGSTHSGEDIMVLNPVWLAAGFVGNHIVQMTGNPNFSLYIGISDLPTQGEVQAILERLNELIIATYRAP